METSQAAQIERRRTSWPWWSLLPLALGAWAPIYAGVRARVASWVGLGVLWSAVAIAGWIDATVTSGSNDPNNSLAGGLIVIAWVGAAATSFIIRSAYERRITSPLLGVQATAKQRLHDRDQARRLAEHSPRLALEMGIGRPDLDGAADAGLIDVNNVPASMMTKLPGVDDALATRIVEARAKLGGFSSLEDLGIALDLDGRLVEALRDRAIFLPRSGF